MQTYNIDSLNIEQKNALLKTEGAVLVTAGAGSGKTNLLTHRIAYLIKEKSVSPYNILAITFTNKAAQEMRERVSQMVYSDGIWISTFHSMCAKMLRMNIDKIGYSRSFTIFSESDSDKAWDQILSEESDKKDIKKQLKFFISDMKNKNLSIEEYESEIKELEDGEKIISYMTQYEEYLLKNNALDFDDLLVKTILLFKSCPSVLRSYQERFKYILVDEFQDTNYAQYILVKMLCDLYKNIFVVGDEDQCIYSWRGASYHNMMRFKNDFGAEIFKLETNYRSTPNILRMANNVISNNSSRIEKVLKSVREEAKEPEISDSYDEKQEAENVVRKILTLSKNNNYKFKDFAVLMRVNAISLPVEQALLSYNIPYRIYGGFKFFERAEIKNVLAYLRLFVNPSDEIAFLRIINFPKRGVGDGAIAKIREIADAEKKSLLEVVLDENNTLTNSLKNKLYSFVQNFKSLLADYESLPLEEFVREVVSRFDIKLAYDKKIEEEANKILNIEALLGNVQDFVHSNQGALLNDYLESVTLISDIDNMDESDVVTVATIHSVKGLEFENVFIVGAEEKIFPISRAFDSQADMEEERRLMYVAITRAKTRLFISYCNTRYLYGRREPSKVSRFIKETGFVPKTKSPVEFSVGSASSYGGYNSYGSSFGSSVTNDNHYSNSYNHGFDKSSFFTSTKLNDQADTSMYKVGTKVVHSKYGMGEVIKLVDNGKCAEIKFDGFGVKTLILDIAPIEIIE